MSSDETPNVPARRDRREAVREKAAAVQLRQRRGRLARIVIGGAVIAALVAGAVFAVVRTLADSASAPQLSPAVQDDDGVVVTEIPASVLSSFSATGDAGDSSPAATDAPSDSATPSPMTSQQVLEVEVYVDYLSQASADFQLANAKQLSEWVSEGAAMISYHPVALLTGKSNGTKYSLRAAGAAACVATYAPQDFFLFNHKLLEQRPDLDTDGLTDTDLADLARALGLGNVEQVSRCVEKGSFMPWVQKATARALAKPLGDTDETLTGPTVLVNGTPYVGDLADAKEFAQFVLTLSSNAYYSTPTPTPTPSAKTTPSPTPTS